MGAAKREILDTRAAFEYTSTMSVKKLLRTEIESAPDVLVQEVYDFFTFLKNKEQGTQRADLIIAESALRKDWLSPEEDAAWRDL